jgi:hypothetical protein
VTNEHQFLLRCHAQSTAAPVRELRATAQATRAGLTLRFALSADLALLCIPVPAPPRAADELWRHTCFEAFVAAAGSRAYAEFNFSPSGEWAAYTFADYRERGAVAPDFDPRIAVRHSADSLMLEASIPRTALPQADTLQLGLCAVIEDEHGAISYWALRHAPGKPDFHHRDAFAGTLDMAAHALNGSFARVGEKQ